MIRPGEFDPEKRTGKRKDEKQHQGNVCVQWCDRYSLAASSDAAFLVAATKIVLDLKREAGK